MKRIIKTIAAVFAAFSLILTGTGCSSDNSTSGSSQGSSGKTTLTLGVIKALGTATPYVAQKLGYFDEAGIDIKIIDFSDGSSLMEAFAASDIDIAMCGAAPVANWFSKGVDVQVVASANGGGHVILSRKDTGITNVEQLKGHTLAEPNLGTVTDTLLRSYILKNSAINPETDLTIVPGMKPADMAISLFDTREVDAILTWEPYVSQALATYDDAVVVYDSPLVLKQELGTESFYAVNVVAASKKVIDNRKDELKKFLSVYEKTVDYINTNPAANADIAAVLEMDESIVKSAIQRIDYTSKLDKDALERTLRWGFELGYFSSIPAREEFFADLG